MESHKSARLAVLIDAENAQASIIEDLLCRISSLGEAIVKRAYADWSKDNVQGWKEMLHKTAIQPVQQFSYTNGKNSTDVSLVIDAMDLLYSGRLDGFCLVSSDGDFTPLATRIRQDGLVVYGFGKENTPEPFRTACTKFSSTQDLKPQKAPAVNRTPSEEEVEKMIRQAVTENKRKDGWTAPSAVGSTITNAGHSIATITGGQGLEQFLEKQAYINLRRVASVRLKNNGI